MMIVINTSSTVPHPPGTARVRLRVHAVFPATGDSGILELMSDLQTMPSPDLDVLTDEETETEEPTHAHIVKTAPGENAAAKVMEARVMGTPIEALCGFVWVPSRDPKQLPVCPKCKEVYEMYRFFNDGLNETPRD